jgi:hypothetical protein
MSRIIKKRQSVTVVGAVGIEPRPLPCEGNGLHPSQWNSIEAPAAESTLVLDHAGLTGLVLPSAHSSNHHRIGPTGLDPSRPIVMSGGTQVVVSQQVAGVANTVGRRDSPGGCPSITTIVRCGTDTEPTGGVPGDYSLKGEPPGSFPGGSI